MVGEREILASLVEFKHHSMAEMIRNEKEEKKTKAEVQGLTKKDKKHKTSNRYGDIEFKAYSMILGGFRGFFLIFFCFVSSQPSNDA